MRPERNPRVSLRRRRAARDEEDRPHAAECSAARRARTRTPMAIAMTTVPVGIAGNASGPAAVLIGVIVQD